MSQPSIGRIVHYTLTAQDAAATNKRRADFRTWRRALGRGGDSGHVAHFGNEAREGDVFPAMVVRVFDPSTTTANLQVFLDGTDTYWATSIAEGDRPGTWCWPPRV